MRSSGDIDVLPSERVVPGKPANQPGVAGTAHRPSHHPIGVTPDAEASPDLDVQLDPVRVPPGPIAPAALATQRRKGARQPPAFHGRSPTTEWIAAMPLPLPSEPPFATIEHVAIGQRPEQPITGASRPGYVSVRQHGQRLAPHGL